MKLILVSLVMSFYSLGAFSQAGQNHLIVPLCKKKESDTCNSLAKELYKTLRMKLIDKDIYGRLMIGKVDVDTKQLSFSGAPECFISIAFSSEEVELKVKTVETTDVLRAEKRAQNLINQMEDHSLEEGYLHSIVRYSSGASKNCDGDDIALIHGHEVSSFFIER